MYRTRLGQSVDPFGGVGVPTTTTTAPATTTTAESWGKAVGTIVGAAAEIFKRPTPPQPQYFGPPATLAAVRLPTSQPTMPGWLLPVGLAVLGGGALWMMSRR